MRLTVRDNSQNPESQTAANGRHQARQVDSEDVVSLSILNDTLVARSQLTDYAYRGTELETYHLISFVKDTYERHLEHEIPVEGEEGETPRTRPTRIRHTRSLYLPEHAHAGRVCRVIRPANHKNLLSIPGQYFPRNDVPEKYPFYCAAMLALLKPWRVLDDLRRGFPTWEAAIEDFLTRCGQTEKDILANIQYFYESADTAARRQTQRREATFTAEPGRNHNTEEDSEEQAVTIPGQDEVDDGYVDVANMTAEGIEKMLETLQEAQHSLSTRMYGKQAVDIATMCGLFQNINFGANAASRSLTQRTSAVRTRSGGDVTDLENWKSAMQLESARIGPISGENSPQTSGLGDGGSVNSLESMQGVQMTGISEHAQVENLSLPEEEEEGEIARTLNPEQTMAYRIVRDHLQDELAGANPEQLLLNLQGGPGTGKSQVIKAITRFFEGKNASKKLLRSAYTGIAASVIDGQTLHTLTRIPTNQDEPSRRAIVELAERYTNVRYLIIDEISMISKKFFARVEKVFTKIAAVRDERNQGRPFGGMNVIICGDFHQFPPVACSKTGPLYWPTTESDPEEDKMGRKIYEMFQTVVVLKRQMRSADPRWNLLLENARVGKCTEEDLQILNSLKLDPRQSQYGGGLWDDAVLVTPRHSVRNAWNAAALERHCHKERKSRKSQSLHKTPSMVEG